MPRKIVHMQIQKNIHLAEQLCKKIYVTHYT